MAWLSEWIVLLAQTGLIAVLNVRFPETIGGGLVFVGLIAVSEYLSRVYKEFAEDLRRLALAALCLEVLNVVAGLEHRGSFQRPLILTGYLLTALAFSVLHYQVNISPIRIRRGGPVERDPIRTELVKRIATMFALVPAQILGLFGLTSGLVLWMGQESWLVDRNWLTMSGLILSWQILGALAHKAFINKFTPEQMACALNVRPRRPIPAVARKVAGGLLIVFLLGTLAEMGRGLWLFWIGTYAFWVLTLVNGWRVWRHVFSGRDLPCPSGDIPPGYNIVADFRVLLYTILAASVYVIALAVLLGLTSPRILH